MYSKVWLLAPVSSRGLCFDVLTVCERDILSVVGALSFVFRDLQAVLGFFEKGKLAPTTTRSGESIETIERQSHPEELYSKVTKVGRVGEETEAGGGLTRGDG